MRRVQRGDTVYVNWHKPQYTLKPRYARKKARELMRSGTVADAYVDDRGMVWVAAWVDNPHLTSEAS